MKKNKIWLLMLLLVSLLFTGCSQEVTTKKASAKKLEGYEEKLVDLTTMTGKAVFTDVELESNLAMRGFGVDAKNQAFYISQPYRDEASDLVLTKVEKVGDTWQGTEWMHLWESGQGELDLTLAEDGKTYLWAESNGTIEGYGSTLSYVEWQSGAFLQTEYGEVISFDDAGDEYMSPQVDEENNWLVLRVNGEEGPYYAFYELDKVLAGETPECIYKVACPRGQTASTGKDDSNGRFDMLTCRGFTVGGGYIYQVHGNATGKIYISAYNLKGELVYVRFLSECSELTYRQPEAISYVDGKIYILLVTGTKTVSVTDHLASVVTFE